MRTENGERRVPLWLVFVVVLAYIPAGTFAMTLGALLSSDDEESGGAGAVRCKGIEAGKYESFFESVLEGIDAPLTDAHVLGLAAWHKAEGGTAKWNPLNTTHDAQGATEYNSVGVKNYPSEAIGVSATIKTLLNGNYGKILVELRADALDIQALGGAVDGSVWGTKHLSDVTENCTTAVQAAARYVKDCPRFPRGTPWGGHLNGQIPPRTPQMIQLPSSMNGQWLRCDAGKNFVALSAEFKKEFGYDISVTDGYRTLASQRRLYAQKGPGLAATPGRSNHGWGCAVDLGTGINNFNSPQFRWMKQNAQRFGWVHPAWAESSQFEPWHWEYQYCSGTQAA